jgi:hypothetical protein
MKKCTKCGVEKELDQFSNKKENKSGLGSICKKCINKEFSKDKNKKDGLTIWCKQCNSEYKKHLYIENKEKIKFKQKEYYKTERGKEVHKKAGQKRIKSGKQTEYERNRKNIDINYKIVGNLRIRINQVLKGNSKSQHTLDLLGCSLEQFKEHLESLFFPGMTFENHGRGNDKWHIDHYIACNYFDLTDLEQQKICFHFLNLRPFWATDNRKKSDILPADYLDHIEFIKNWLNLK